MGNHNSGRKQQEMCGRGLHDLTDEDNVIIIEREGRTERMCKPCQRRRAREWWRRNYGKR